MSLKNQNNKKHFLQFTSIPFEMFIIIFVGYRIGNWLDKKYVNEDLLYTTIITLLSVMIAMIYIIRRIQKISK